MITVIIVDRRRADLGHLVGGAYHHHAHTSATAPTRTCTTPTAAAGTARSALRGNLRADPPSRPRRKARPPDLGWERRSAPLATAAGGAFRCQSPAGRRAAAETMPRRGKVGGASHLRGGQAGSLRAAAG